MDIIILKMLELFAAEGPLGLAIIACFLSMLFCLVMGWFYHIYKTNYIKLHLEESRQDKAQLMDLVRNNTHSIDKNTSALENNTYTVRNCIVLIHQLFEKLNSRDF